MGLRMNDRLLNRRRPTLSENPVQCGQVGRHPSQLMGYRGEIRGQPGDDSGMRFGHTAIVAANEVAADEYNYSSRPCLLVEAVFDRVARQFHPIADLQLAKRRLHVVFHRAVAQ